MEVEACSSDFFLLSPDDMAQLTESPAIFFDGFGSIARQTLNERFAILQAEI
jgi:hypothetical protein